MYGFVYSSKLSKCLFSVDSAMRVEPRWQGPPSPSTRNVFSQVRSRVVLSMVEGLVQVRYRYPLD